MPRDLTSAWRRMLLSPQGVLVLSFAGLIVAGALLLWLPCSHRGAVGPLDALFTATSAVCVTGLVVLDTGSDFTLSGQVVILLLIQLGALGIMTFATLVFQMMGGRLSFRSLDAVRDSLGLRGIAAEFGRRLRGILLVVVIFEAAGALLLFLLVPSGGPAGERAFAALFHAVSAFCNAGFSLNSDSLVAFRGHWGVLSVFMVLIVAGGLGHTVLGDAWHAVARRVRGARWTGPHVTSLHARVVLRTTAWLLLAGAAGLFLIGLALPRGRMGVLDAVFQSVTARTAGFNSVDIAPLPAASLLWIAMLMFVGGSPGSCAGGVKTTALAVWLAKARARLRGEDDISLMGFRIPSDTIRRTTLVLGLAMGWNVLGTLFLLVSEAGHPGLHLEHLFFEQISAFGTVGLSTGVTPELTVPGRVWVIVTMFVGRLGPVTLAAWVVRQVRAHVRHPAGRVFIG